MKVKLLYLAPIWAMFFLNSCAIFEQSESEILQDATPPAGYNPTFVKSSRQYKSDELVNPKIIVSRIDVSQASNLKIYTHIIDENSIYLTGAPTSAFDKKYKNLWCEVIDSIGGIERPVENYTVKEVADESQKIAAAIVMDHSGSMGENRAFAVQDAVLDLIKKKKADDMFALIKYDNHIGVEVPLTKSSDELSSRLQRTGLLQFGGMTAIANSIDAGIRELDKAPAGYVKTVIVFTDGWDNSSTIARDSIVRYAKSKNVFVCAVDFGENINEGYMSGIAESTGGIYHRLYSTKDFSLVFDDVYRRLKNYYLVEFKTEEFGPRKLRFKLCTPKEKITTESYVDNTPDIGAITLLNVNFDFDKAVIQKKSEAVIQNVVSLLKAFPKMCIEIRGHTDNASKSGDADYNLKLSQKRADAVKAAIAAKGINASRIIATGYGDKNPVADNSTEEGRALNRRTEFIILKK